MPGRGDGQKAVELRQSSVPALRPFDETRGRLRDEIADRDVLELVGIGDPVQIEMPDAADTRLVGLRDGVGGAAYRPAHSQRPQRRARQRGLAGAEAAGKPDDSGGARVPQPQDRFERVSERLSRPLRRSRVGQGDYAVRRRRPGFAHPRLQTPGIRAGPRAGEAPRSRRPRACRALHPGPPRLPPPRAGRRPPTRHRTRCNPGRAAPQRHR